ncbi:OST-HTH/LOTUS domain-containing protein [Microbacterium oleivorans]|uniref:OST-HTH/LOTUS domain-containing protein n=1 Tax=Microbacterium oleivorans TaxID=273677 RepID=UPI0034DE9A15
MTPLSRHNSTHNPCPPNRVQLHFTRLATRIREDGVTVYGFGEDKTPASFRNACDTFTYLEVLREGEVEALAASPQRVSSKELRSNTKLVSGLRSSVAIAAGEDDWANLSAVGSLMRKQHPDFDPRNWGYAKISDLVRTIGLFDVEPRPTGGPQIRNKSK